MAIAVTSAFTPLFTNREFYPTVIATSMIADELSINDVRNHHIYSTGFHNDKMVTIGLFGHVWTIYDFMSESKIASEMMEKLKD